MKILHAMYSDLVQMEKQFAVKGMGPAEGPLYNRAKQIDHETDGCFV